MHTDGKSGAPGNAQSNEDIRSGGKNGAEGGKTAAKVPSGRRRVRPYCIAMAFAALAVLVLPVLIRPVGAQEAAAYLVPVLAVTVLPALIIYLTVLRAPAVRAFGRIGAYRHAAACMGKGADGGGNMHCGVCVSAFRRLGAGLRGAALGQYGRGARLQALP